ncbi:MAG: methyltransferase, partial [Bradyrhizobium sp.]|nr:methyltransferase [Bradyrhizobium sp.]
MAEINLLNKLPRGKRNVSARQHAKTDEHIRVSREYGQMYFDGPREYGYGGYRYDGRWVPVAQDMIAHFDLKAGDRVLDVGAAKGFLVKDFMKALPGLEAFGLEISKYALMHCEVEAIGR